MAEPLITLTTDFGDSAPYVSVMKGVIYALCPVARVVDLTHAIAPQNIRQAAYFLATAVPYFPAGTIHVCVVDPGVGTERAALYTQVDGQHLVGPDNGLFTLLWRHARERPSLVRRLTEARFWRPVVSATFSHGVCRRRNWDRSIPTPSNWLSSSPCARAPPARGKSKRWTTSAT